MLHGAALLHHQHVAAHLLHHGGIVHDEQVGQPQLLLQLPQQVQHLGLHRHVRGTGGLVQDDHVRLRSQGAGDGDTLALTTGELLGKAGGERAGRQPASVVVTRIDREATWPFTSIVDLRVDDDPDAPAVLSHLLDARIAAAAERLLVGRV